MPGLPRFRSLVRGVSNTQVGLARLAHIDCRSRVNPRSVAAHPSRRALRDDCVSRKRAYLRPPQDEADKRPAPCHLDSIRAGTALVGSPALLLYPALVCLDRNRPRMIKAMRAA